VIPLDKTGSRESLSAGSKASSLAALGRLGIPVPAGFVITAPVLDRHLESLGLAGKIREITGLTGTSREEMGIILEGIREEIRRTPLPVMLEKEIAERLERFGSKPLAVRSSGTMEDLPSASFAGVYDTFLDVKGVGDCIAAVRNCWASLWTERAFHYREKRGISRQAAGMAVVVQEYISADFSGVIFTADPVTGDRGKMIVESCPGGGKSLVSGRVTPDRMVVDKKSLAVLEGGAGVLECKTLSLMARLARRAEIYFGCPQDIEWALKGRDLYFLQTRPITTLERTCAAAEIRVWSNSNAGEVLPDVASPMSWLLVKSFVSQLFNENLKRLGIDPGDEPPLGLVAGRVYFEVTALVSMIRHLPGMNKMDLKLIFGGFDDREAREHLRKAIPGVKVRINYPKVLFRLPLLLLRMLFHGRSEEEAFMAKLRERTAALRRMEPSGRTDGGLFFLASGVLDSVRSIADNFHLVAGGMVYFENLGLFCRRFLRDPDGRILNRLLSNRGGMDSAEPAFRLWEMASLAGKSREVREIILSGVSFGEAREKLGWTEDGAGFLRLWENFMEKHGHHARGEVDLMNPRWSETPDYILGMVRHYLTVGRNADPAAEQAGRISERERLDAECRGRLKPLMRLLFSFLLKRAARGLALREGVKSEVVRHVAALRFILLELGGRLAARGILARKEDVFFLTLEELGSIIEDEAAFEAGSIVHERRAEYEKNLSLKPPPVVVGSFDPQKASFETAEHAGDMLEGQAVSAGTARGPARVILRRTEDEWVQPGEILIIPFADPGWTPYFVTAAGIVMDMGGALSHGSIIAREYGIPAVVNVGKATSMITTGQQVQVDGNRGTVKLFPLTAEDLSV
jgi:pyruvate,water dikinase